MPVFEPMMMNIEFPGSIQIKRDYKTTRYKNILLLSVKTKE